MRVMAVAEDDGCVDHPHDSVDDVADARPRGGARPVLALIRWYQLARTGRPSPCRFVPSCSAYAAEAVAVHGMFRGLGLAARRLARCHPWGGHGYDPVPEKKAPRRCSS
jgi:putative membrane protein insertion efficiency factor